MDERILYFFEGHMDALPLYERLEQRILNEIEDVQVKVQKTQISFYNRHLFACVSFAKVRKAKERPDTYIVVTVGTGRRQARIAQDRYRDGALSEPLDSSYPDLRPR